MKRLYALALLLLVVSCGPNEEFLQLQNEVASLQTELADLEAEKSELSTQLDESSGELEAAQVQISTLQGQIDSLEATKDQQAGDLSQYRRALNGLICPDKINNMSYDTILNATSRLEAYVNSLSGVQYTSGGYRDSLWGNADSKVHAIRYNWEDGQQYTMQFLVYFDEFDFEKATLFIDGQCWVDPPVTIP